MASALAVASRKLWRCTDLQAADDLMLSLITEALHRIGILLQPTIASFPDLVFEAAIPGIYQQCALLAALATRSDPVSAVWPVTATADAEASKFDQPRSAQATALGILCGRPSGRSLHAMGKRAKHIASYRLYLIQL